MATEKAKTYTDNIWDTAVIAKEITDGALSKVEADKKNTEEALSSLRSRYKKLDTKIS